MLGRGDLRSIEFAHRELKKLSPQRENQPARIESAGPVASEVFRTIQRISDEKDILPVFVILPVEEDISRDSDWRRWILARLDEDKIALIDITPTLRSLPASLAATFFIPERRPTRGHYTEVGNEWAAAELYSHLVEIPEIRSLLARHKHQR